MCASVNEIMCSSEQDCVNIVALPLSLRNSYEKHYSAKTCDLLTDSVQNLKHTLNHDSSLKHNVLTCMQYLCMMLANEKLNEQVYTHYIYKNDIPSETLQTLRLPITKNTTYYHVFGHVICHVFNAHLLYHVLPYYHFFFF